jgi:hypothetical protein
MEWRAWGKDESYSSTDCGLKRIDFEGGTFTPEWIEVEVG